MILNYFDQIPGKDPPRLAEELLGALPATGLLRHGLWHHPHPDHGQQAPPGRPGCGRPHRNAHAGSTGLG